MYADYATGYGAAGQFVAIIRFRQHAPDTGFDMQRESGDGDLALAIFAGTGMGRYGRTVVGGEGLSGNVILNGEPRKVLSLVNHAS